MPEHLYKYLATNQYKQLYSTVVSLSEKIGSLEARLSTTNTRTNTSKPNPPKEREFWFIQERAKYLWLRINADQRIKIEMFANNDYKKRHGQIPNRQPYRATQAFAYPKEFVQVLDATINNVVKQG